MKGSITVFLFSLLMMLLISSHIFANGREDYKFIDKEIVGIVIGNDTEEKLFKLHGKGISIQEGYAWCYYNPDDKQYIVFELGEDKRLTGVIVSEESDLWKRCKEKQILKEFITGKNVKLGVSTDYILKVYGAPHEKEIEKDIFIYKYHSDYKRSANATLFFDVYLYFNNKGLIKMSIHDGN